MPRSINLKVCLRLPAIPLSPSSSPELTWIPSVAVSTYNSRARRNHGGVCVEMLRLRADNFLRGTSEHAISAFTTEPPHTVTENRISRIPRVVIARDRTCHDEGACDQRQHVPRNTPRKVPFVSRFYVNFSPGYPANFPSVARPPLLLRRGKCLKNCLFESQNARCRPQKMRKSTRRVKHELVCHLRLRPVLYVD